MSQAAPSSKVCTQLLLLLLLMPSGAHLLAELQCIWLPGCNLLGCQAAVHDRPALLRVGVLDFGLEPWVQREHWPASNLHLGAQQLGACILVALHVQSEL